MNITVLVPVFNDWASCRRLVVELEATLAKRNRTAALLVVDDGSTLPDATGEGWPIDRGISSVRVLRLRRNLGHQRAICVGLAFLNAEDVHDAVVIMDSDGEDQPPDVNRLLDALAAEPDRVVFARRTRRSESMWFRLGYRIYRWAHRALTGFDIHFGNFSVVPREQLRSLSVVSELWNNYAAAVLVSRIPHTSIPSARGRRYEGRSSMNVVALVVHGLSAIAAFGAVAGVRIIAGCLVVAVLAILGLAAAVGIRLFTDLAIPGWATAAAALSLVLLLQASLGAVTLVFLVLGGRNLESFIPERDYRHFVDAVRDR